MASVNIESVLKLPCGVDVKNRICKAAMTEGLADEQNRATDKHVTLYSRWAEGGSGILLTGNIQIDHRYLERPGNVVVEGKQSNEQLSRLRAYAEAGRIAALPACNCTARMAISFPNFCRPTSTPALMTGAAASRTARAFCWKAFAPCAKRWATSFPSR